MNVFSSKFKKYYDIKENEIQKIVITNFLYKYSNMYLCGSYY